MKKLFIVLAILIIAIPSYAWKLSWIDVTGEDGYIVSYKDYPTGYTYPANPAPAALIEDMTGATQINLPADTIEWPLPGTFVEGQRYVFLVQATLGASLSAYSDFLCWSYPTDIQVVEIPVDPGTATIQVNIYQIPR